MMGPLIHTRQGRLMRLLDVLVTLVAWCGFLYLFVRGVLAVLRYQGPDMASRLELIHATFDTLGWYLVIAIFNASVLAAWALYNQIRRRVERRGKIPALDDDKLSASFRLTPQLLRALRSGQIIVVHNDEHGGIADVVARGMPGMLPHPGPANDALGQRRGQGAHLRA